MSKTTIPSGGLGGGLPSSLTVGSAVAEDTKIVFDGNAQDYHIGLDDSVDDLVIGKGSALGTTANIVIDEAGCVTKPLQPAFLAVNEGSDSITNATETTIALDTEIFDVNGDVSSNTFTAPVTGRYAFQYHVQINDISTQDSGTYYYIEINTSNRVFYELSSINAAIGSSSGQNYFCFTGSVTADMDASDTCNLRVVMGGTSGTGPSDISTNSHFSGHLVC